MRKTIWIPDSDQQIKVLQALLSIQREREGVTTRKPSLEEIGRRCSPPLSIPTVHRRMKELLKARVVSRSRGKNRAWASNYEFPERKRA